MFFKINFNYTYIFLKNRLQSINMTKQEKINFIKSTLLQKYKNAKSELNYNNLYELIVAVMLSAQCTDKRVNLITPEFFKVYPDIKSLANAKLSSVKMLINSCSFFNNKANNLLKMANAVIDEFGGEIPLNQKDLMSLAGVGQKTANVVLIEYLNENKMAVDTHVFRVSHRLGLSKAKTPEQTEIDLSKAFKTELNYLHQAMVLFGRYECKSIKPQCKDCVFIKICKEKQKNI